MKEESEKAGLRLNIQKNEDHGIWSHHFMANRWGKCGNSVRFHFLGLHNQCRWWLQPPNWKDSCDKPRHCIIKQRHHFADKDLYSQSYGFFSSHICMWELDHKESWVPKNWCFQIVLLVKTLESLLDCKEIKSVNPKGNLSWIFIGRAGAEAEAPIVWAVNAKSRLIGRPWCWERLKAEG